MKIVFHHRTQRKLVEGVHITGVINGLKGLGHEVIEVALVRKDTFDKSILPRRMEGFKQRMLRIIAKYLPNFLFRLGEVAYNAVSFFKLRKVFGKVKPALFYERYAYFNFAGILAAKLCGIPSILEVNIVTAMQDKRKIALKQLAGFIEKKILLSCDVIFVVSNYLKDCLIQHGIDPRKIYVQPNAFTPPAAIRREPIKIKNLDGNETTIGFLGGLAFWYKLDRLVEVFGAIHTSFPNTRLMFIGDGPERPVLEEMVERLHLTGKVIFCGRVSHDEAFALLSHVQIGVIPSTNFWGSPMKLFEYMGSGIPVVAPDLDVITSVMTEGVHGKTFPYDDFSGFKDSLVTLLRDQRQRVRMGEAARQHVLTNHTWDKVAQHIIQVAENVLKNNA